MKKSSALFLLAAGIVAAGIFAAGVLAACTTPNGDDKNNTTPQAQGSTTVVFDNTQGVCEVVVYSYPTRQEGDLVARVNAGETSTEISWIPSDSYSFYVTYMVKLNGIDALVIPFVAELGKDQIAVKIEAGTRNAIAVPRLSEAAPPDALLSRSAHIIVQNASSYSVQLFRSQSAPVMSENPAGSYMINAGSAALYKITAGSAAPYSLLVGIDFLPFTGTVGSFVAGHVYQFVFDLDGGAAALSLAAETEVKQENVLPPPADAALPRTPGAPALTVGDGMLTAQWGAAGKAQSYEVYAGTGAEPPEAPVKTVSSTTTMLTGLANRTLYSVWVRGVNDAGTGNLSPAARAAPWSPADSPDTPALPALAEGVNQLTITWQKAGGASLYEVFVGATTTPPTDPAQTTVGTSAVVSGLENRIYYVWVRARNAAGVSGYSPIEAGTPQNPSAPPAAPDAPALAAGLRELTVTWQGVEYAAAYEVWYSTQNSPAAATKWGGDISGGLTQTVINGLVNETTYYVWVRGKNAAGTGAWSEAAAGRPTPEPPAAPGGLAASGATQTTISLAWNTVNGAASYKIYRAASSGGAYTQCGISASASYTDSGLTPATTYYYKVSAVNGAGESAQSTAAQRQTSAPIAVTALNLSGIVTAPVANATPQTTTAALSHNQYTVTSLAWQTSTGGAAGSTFAESTVYKAVLSLQAGAAYSFSGLSSSSFTYSGATSVTAALSGQMATVTVTFPATAAVIAWDIGTADDFITQLNWIKTNGAPGGEYTIALTGDFSLGPQTLNANTDAKLRNTTVTLVGQSGERTITLNANGRLFTVSGYNATNSITFVLDSNVVLRGKNDNDTSVIYTTGGARFIMRGGEISGNTNSYTSTGGGVIIHGSFTMTGGAINDNILSTGGPYSNSYGGGVYVQGEFTMSGGTISNNTVQTSSGNHSHGGGVFVNGIFNMSGGLISGNTAVNSGGGVYACNTFTMSGGSISGNSAAFGGGVLVNETYGAFTKSGNSTIYGNEAGLDSTLKNTSGSGNGHAVYVSSTKRRNTTAYPATTMDSRIEGSAGGWE